ncbi:MAG: hypothetical protein IT210_23850 [Armatimonadetes bacterium]|nr:hypothetical protein [Armatimonadota bacterium]
MHTIDYEAHNAEVREVWDAYRKRQPVRVPIIFGINPRYTMFGHEANLKGIDFERYFNDPQAMMERQLEHQEWVRLNVPQDAEMGMPKEGWHVYVDFQNSYEQAWFGCAVRYYKHEVPDTEPILKDDDKKRMLFDRGIPDPFEDGWMKRNWEYYDYFLAQKEKGFTRKGLPLLGASPTGMGTDGPVTMACNLRGASEFFTDLLEDQDYALELLDYITEAAIARIQAFRKKFDQPIKTQGWGFADDSIQLISTRMYEELIYPFHRRLVDTFSAGGPNSIHLCGDSTRHFPFLKERLDVQSFDTGYPVDFAWLRKTLGPEVEILGGPSVPLLQISGPEEVRGEVRRILGTGIMAGGRYILREGNNLAPGTPLENLWAMYEAGREFGRYS